MDILYSILIGYGISAVIAMAQLLTRLVGRFAWPFYVSLAIYVPFFDFGLPKLPYIIVSVFFYLFSIIYNNPINKKKCANNNLC